MVFLLENVECSLILMCCLGMNFIPGSVGHITKVFLNGGRQGADSSHLEAIAKKFNLQHDEIGNNASTELSFDEDILKAKYLNYPKVHVDFNSAQLNWRQTHGGGEALVRAVGMGNPRPYVIDATGGFGTDAFMLYSYGCKVKVFEKNPIVASLLEDGVRRAGELFGDNFIDNFQFQFGDSLAYLQSLNRSDLNQTNIPDVIYLDPMFPKSKKSALVKKNIKFLQNLESYEPFNDEALIQIALKTARRRVVVKRPSASPFLGGFKTNTIVKSKKYRFDIYPTHKLL